MIVLGALSVVCGLCMASMGALLNNPEMTSQPQYAQMQQQFQQIEREFGITVQQFFVFMGAVPLAAGAILGALGFGVRGGAKGVIIASLVYVAILLSLLGLAILAGLVQGLALGGGPEIIVGLCFYAAPFAMLAVVLVWLIQAWRAFPKIEWARQHYQSQMWQYQQYQQAYLQNPQPPSAPGGPPPPPPTGVGYGFPAQPNGPAPGKDLSQDREGPPNSPSDDK